MSPRRYGIAGSVAILGIAGLALAPTALSAAETGAVASPTASAKALALVPAKIKARLDVRMAYRRYALCAASNITPSSRKTSINGRTYTLGTGLCPIVTGWTVYNKELQGTSPTVKGPSTIWSSFGSPTTFPQYSAETGWTVGAPVGRTLVIGTAPNTGMANFWGYPCVVTTPVNIGGTNYPMAACAGPLMENIDNRPVTVGSTMFTDGPVSASIPVGLAKMTSGALMGMEPFFLNPFPGS